MTNATTGLTCPKCRGVMNSYERNGVTIDQCADCRGIFLDRGELERLIDAEGSFYQSSAAAAPAAAEQAWAGGKQHGGGHGGGGHGGGHGGRGTYGNSGNSGRRKRGGFLGELFD